MTGEVKLLPCPFCGSSVVTMYASNGVPHGDSLAGGSRSVECTDCGATGPVEPSPRVGTAWNTRPTLVTGQLQEDGGDSNECPECQGRGERWVQPDGLPRAPYPAQCDYCHGTGTMATRAASETPTPGLTDDVVKELVKALEPFAKVADAFDYWCSEAMPIFSYPIDGTRLELAIHDCPNAIGGLAKSDFATARAALAKARTAQGETK